jgi:outer membrane protein OmpA-like peptidoglycan-associated protein
VVAPFPAPGSVSHSPELLSWRVKIHKSCNPGYRTGNFDLFSNAPASPKTAGIGAYFATLTTNTIAPPRTDFTGARTMTDRTTRYYPTRPSASGMRVLAAILAAAMAVPACTTTNPYTGEQEVNKTSKGAGIGALAGLATAILVGGNRKTLLLGAGIGALAGGGIGLYMDKQEDKLRMQLQSTGVSVTRNGDSIILNMPGNVTFATNSSNISADFYRVLDSVALVINEFEKTYVDIVGHTDSTGALQYNQTLSEARASSVARYLESQKVISQRIITRGAGPSQPVASNDTPDGRALNRRVEIILTPIT